MENIDNEKKYRKEIIVKLNNMDYRYDVYQMINLFYGFSNISFVENNEDDFDYYVEVKGKELTVENNKNKLEQKYIYNIDEKYRYKDELKKGIFKYFREKTNKELPWGTLIGIRPSKRAMKMIEEGMSEEEIIREFNEVSCSRRDKAELCIDVAKREKQFLKEDNKSVSVYVGMPFCPSRCLYCSFTSNPIGKSKKIVEPYLNTLKHEIDEVSRFLDENSVELECVYFGGGTPTAVNDEQFYDIMEHIDKKLIEGRNIKEFTLECGRPDSITYNKLETMKKFNVHRISINPQSMNDDTLKRIGRIHSSEEVVEIYNMARELGFDNINMDIIVGLPGEKLEHVVNTCNKIYELKPESITVHGMSVKRASRLYENIVNNIQYEIPEQNELNMMYEETVKLAEKLHMNPYYMYRQKNMVGNMENVGYSLQDKECIYNIEMIEDKQSIIALGADAVTKVVFNDSGIIERVGNHKDVKVYIENIDDKLKSKFELLKKTLNMN